MRILFNDVDRRISTKTLEMPCIPRIGEIVVFDKASSSTETFKVQEVIYYPEDENFDAAVILR